jgi:hypothetical protein
MTEDDRLIRQLYAETAAGPRDDHPDEAAWEAMALGELPAVRRQELVDHVARCAECASVYRGLRTLATEAARFDAGVPRTAPRSVIQHRPARWVYAGLAAAAVLLVTLLPLRRQGTAPTPGPAATGDDVRSGEKPVPVPLEPQGVLAGPPRAFRWQGLPGVTRYRVELSSRAGDLVWSSPPVEGLAVDWPATVSPAPGVYHWQVIALPDVERPLTSPVRSALVSFEIAGR